MRTIALFQHRREGLDAGTLDRSDELDCAAHIWIKRKQAWITIPEGVPSGEEPGPLDEMGAALGFAPPATA